MAKRKGICNDCGGLTNSCRHTDPEPFGDERDESVGKPAKYHLTERDGKAVQEVLRRYIDEELLAQREALRVIHEETRQLDKDIDYIEGLAKLFD